MVADSSFFRSSMAFTVYAPFYSADNCTLLILPLVKGFHHGLSAVLLTGWQRIAHSSARLWLSRRFVGCFVPQIAAHCSFFHSSKAFTVCPPDCSTDVSGLLIPPLVSGFPDGSFPLLRCGWHRVARSSDRDRLSLFGRRFAQWMTAHCSYFHSSTAFRA